MVKNIKFRNVRSNFQSRLTNDVTKINKSPNQFVPADKTNNLYELSVDSYKKLLKENVIASYQKTATSTLDRINAEAISIAHNLKLEDRIESFPPSDAFITLKDQSLVFCDGDLWVKKSGAEFDATMGSFDGAEICELVGLYLLHHLAKIFGKEAVGLYRDDGLAILRNASGPDAERVRKK